MFINFFFLSSRRRKTIVQVLLISNKLEFNSKWPLTKATSFPEDVSSSLSSSSCWQRVYWRRSQVADVSTKPRWMKFTAIPGTRPAKDLTTRNSTKNCPKFATTVPTFSTTIWGINASKYFSLWWESFEIIWSVLIHIFI